MIKPITVLFMITISTSAIAEYCTLTREEVSGNNKFCFYGCIRGEQVVTINSLYPCPLMKNFASSDIDDSSLKHQFLVANKYEVKEFIETCSSENINKFAH